MHLSCDGFHGSLEDALSQQICTEGNEEEESLQDIEDFIEVFLNKLAVTPDLSAKYLFNSLHIHLSVSSALEWQGSEFLLIYKTSSSLDIEDTIFTDALSVVFSYFFHQPLLLLLRNLSSS
ncbi:hypothetical protein L218DRAFT_1002947 [Marasmius fiardii PR-910]|nr:hypothetical protein L218DRAFT_1002947 [Marasmius fiardii PR-910]